jgi:antitoxin VapB
LRQRRRKASVEELLAIAPRISSQAKKPYLEHGDYLYDERGLPK